jgi:hypothetical protein
MSPFNLFAVSRAITHASSGNKTEMEVLLELDCYLQRTAWSDVCVEKLTVASVDPVAITT